MHQRGIFAKPRHTRASAVILRGVRACSIHLIPMRVSRVSLGYDGKFRLSLARDESVLFREIQSAVVHPENF